MNERVKKLWLAALRNRKYKQGQSFLRSDKEHYCCLGVLCDLYAEENKTEWGTMTSEGVYKFLGETSFLPKEVVEWAGLSSSAPIPVGYDDNLGGMNDDGVTFPVIASIIEESL
jgi:hypothetical protein